jgi:RNA polymerase sigma factor (sigma-70 family)
MRTEDGFLVSKCLNGDPEAFGILVEKYKAGIYALAYSRLRNFQDAEDITQETFLTAYQKLPKLRRWDSFASWLYSITIILCRRLFQSGSKHPDKEYIEDQDPSIIDSYSEKSYHDDQASKFIQDIIDSLPEIFQQVVSLHYLGGLTSEDIANALGVSPEVVRKRLSRARLLIKEDMLASTFEMQKLQADFTFNIIQAIKHIKIHAVPKTSSIPWGLSLTGIISFAIIGTFTPVYNTSPEIGLNGLIKPNSVRMSKDREYQVPVNLVNISKINSFSLFRNFDDKDVSDWVGGYYEGTVDLNNERLGKPIIKASSKAARTGKYGLIFTKDKESGSSCTASSPAFGPLKKRFQVDLDFILFDDENHNILFGEKAPFETYDEKMILCFGVGFDQGLIVSRSKGVPQLGFYNPNEFYHVTMVADPMVNRFDITITGNLRDLNGNPVNKLSMQNLEFEFPITGKGIRRLNLYTGARLSSDIPSVSMGIDNILLSQLE